MNYQIRVAGVMSENRQKIIETLAKHPQIDSTKLNYSLVPEPENPYDSNAVAVYIGNKYKIGYVPKGNIIQEKVKHGVKFSAKGMIVGGKDGLNYGVILNCKTENDDEGIELKSMKTTKVVNQ